MSLGSVCSQDCYQMSSDDIFSKVHASSKPYFLGNTFFQAMGIGFLRPHKGSIQSGQDSVLLNFSCPHLQSLGGASLHSLLAMVLLLFFVQRLWSVGPRILQWLIKWLYEGHVKGKETNKNLSREDINVWTWHLCFSVIVSSRQLWDLLRYSQLPHHWKITEKAQHANVVY